MVLFSCRGGGLGFIFLEGFVIIESLCLIEELFVLCEIRERVFLGL